MTPLQPDDDLLDRRLARFLDARAEEIARGVFPIPMVVDTLSGRLAHRRAPVPLRIVAVAAAIIALALAAALLAAGDRSPITLGDRSMPVALSWSPDGSRLAMVSIDAASRTGGQTQELYLVDADGSNLTKLDSRPVGTAYDELFGPHLWWAPDSRHLSFEVQSKAPDLGIRRDIVVVATDGSPAVALTGTGDASIGSWSPSGERLLYTRFGPATNDIYSVRFDGTDVRRLTTDRQSWAGEWSPDGAHILYVQGVINGTQMPDSGTWVMAADGTGKRRLGPCCDAGWSPDGRAAYLDNDGQRLVAVPVDGDGPATTVVDAPSDVSRSPDGTETATDGSNGIVVRRADGTSIQVTSEGSDSLRGWSPDGRYLAFIGRRSQGAGLFVVPASGGAPVLVGVDAALVPDDAWRPGHLGGDDLTFMRDGIVFVVNANGSGLAPVLARAGPSATGSPQASTSAASIEDRITVGLDGPDRDTYRVARGGRLTIDNRSDRSWIVTDRNLDPWPDCRVVAVERLELAAYHGPGSLAPAIQARPSALCIIDPHQVVSMQLPPGAAGALELMLASKSRIGELDLPGYRFIIDVVTPDVRESASP